MKKILLTLALVGIITSCKNDKSEEIPISNMSATENMEISKNYKSIGDKISDDSVVTSQELLEKYKKLQLGDTINVKFISEVKEVCQNKGCWMKVDLGDQDAMVTFKDYGFFMPKDLSGQQIIMEGKAYVEEMSVEDQRHYAEDGGATPEEALAITEPKRTFSFKANGVLIPELEKH